MTVREGHVVRRIKRRYFWRRIDWPVVILWVFGLIPFCLVAWFGVFKFVQWLAAA